MVLAADRQVSRVPGPARHRCDARSNHLLAGRPLGSMTGMSEPANRWSRATVYPDMWVDPDDDPRNTDGASPDGELATLQDYLASYRLTLTMKCDGLDAEQLARRSVPPSSMSLLGLLRHLGVVERAWRGWFGIPVRWRYGEGDGPASGAAPTPGSPAPAPGPTSGRSVG